MFGIKTLSRYGLEIPYVSDIANATTVDADGTVILWELPEADYEEYFASLVFTSEGRWDSYSENISFTVPLVDRVDVMITPAKYSKMRIL